eukprot:5866587-Lingulodinium_polyedra.AAC.1
MKKGLKGPNRAEVGRGLVADQCGVGARAAPGEASLCPRLMAVGTWATPARARPRSTTMSTTTSISYAVALWQKSSMGVSCLETASYRQSRTRNAGGLSSSGRACPCSRSRLPTRSRSTACSASIAPTRSSP